MDAYDSGRSLEQLSQLGIGIGAECIDNDPFRPIVALDRIENRHVVGIAHSFKPPVIDDLS